MKTSFKPSANSVRYADRFFSLVSIRDKEVVISHKDSISTYALDGKLLAYINSIGVYFIGRRRYSRKTISRLNGLIYELNNRAGLNIAYIERRNYGVVWGNRYINQNSVYITHLIYRYKDTLCTRYINQNGSLSQEPTVVKTLKRRNKKCQRQ